jgi:histidine triad (HIT) family protein
MEVSIKDNIFYKIINKIEPANIIYENDYVCCFDDIYPETPIHILIVPKKYIQSLATIEEEDQIYLSQILLASNVIAKMKNIIVSGFRLISNCNHDGGQDINYLHFHLLGGCKVGRMISLPKESKQIMKERNG